MKCGGGICQVNEAVQIKVNYARTLATDGRNERERERERESSIVERHRVIFYNYSSFYRQIRIYSRSVSHAFPPLRYCFLLKARFYIIFQEAECSRNVCRMFRARLESTIDASSIYVSSVTALILIVVNYHFAREREREREREGGGGGWTRCTGRDRSEQKYF